LSSIEKFKGKRENFIFNTFIYFEPVKRFTGKMRGESKDRSLKRGRLLTNGVIYIIRIALLDRLLWLYGGRNDEKVAARLVSISLFTILWAACTAAA